MGWGYRKRVRLFPGVWMNVSKRGIGLSAGVKGARVSTGPNGTWLSTSFMGLFSRQKLGSPPRVAAGQGRTQGVGCLGLLVVAAGALGVFLLPESSARTVSRRRRVGSRGPLFNRPPRRRTDSHRPSRPPLSLNPPMPGCKRPRR